MRGLRAADCSAERPPRPDARTWGIAIAACHASGRHHEVLRLYEDMRASGLEPDGHALDRVISSCERVGAWDEADRVSTRHPCVTCIPACDPMRGSESANITVASNGPFHIYD
jgi:pentatricopeptide repeat protein